MLILGSILIIPTLFALFGEGKDISLANFSRYFHNIIDRLFGRTIYPGVWHVQYVSEFGFFGFGGMGNLAQVFGFQSLNVYNIVGHHFMPDMPSVTANTPFVVSYYACFGLISILPCVLLVCALDFLLLLVADLRPEFLLPAMTCILVSTTNITSTMLTTLFITYGLALIPLMALLLSKFQNTSFHIMMGYAQEERG